MGLLAQSNTFSNSMHHSVPNTTSGWCFREQAPCLRHQPTGSLLHSQAHVEVAQAVLIGSALSCPPFHSGGSVQLKNLSKKLSLITPAIRNFLSQVLNPETHHHAVRDTSPSPMIPLVLIT